MDFTAIDFETANEKRNSPCSLGLTVIKDNQPVKRCYWLIRPKEMRFSPMNIMIHGIRLQDVEEEKEFDELWPEILPYLENQLVIAHNASFDFSVLRATLDAYHISYPKLNYACTMLISRNFYPFLENAKLNTVNNYLGFEFAHHDAAADADACANILLSVCKELNTEDINTIARETGITIGALYDYGYDRCSKKIPRTTAKKHSFSIPAIPVLKANVLCGQYIAVTGPLKHFSRAEVIEKIIDYGGHYTSSVTKKTNILITNTKDWENLSPEQMSIKLRKAVQKISANEPMQIISEAKLLH